MSFSRSIGSAKYTEARFPKNPKYEHIKRKLDTGHSVTKYMERLADIKKNYRYQKDEIFKRLKVETLAQLILQVSIISDQSESDEIESQVTEESLSLASESDTQSPSEESSKASSPLCSPAVEDSDVCSTERSLLISVINGVGEMDLKLKDDNLGIKAVYKNMPPEKPCPDCPYLLLDLRDREEFDSCHIISAHSFPSVMLLRTMNPFTKEILEYKNRPGKIIIIYDEDERIAVQAATSMCQRGIDNLFMLSGGLKVVAQTFPEGMTTGTFPASCWASPPTSRRKKSTAPPPPPQRQPAAAETRCWFTEDELVKIQERLDKLLPYSNSSSKTISVRKKPDLSTCVYRSMFSCVFSCVHQLDVQLSDVSEAQHQSPEDTVEIERQSRPGWKRRLLQ
ncbi:LOW QUALITY PROTEIN: centrosomal protein of 41 kDa [Takifugu flavidus]|uniref:LOW QUALITY PROTEIN: centrosomal protein of 41 kDa n=1 Tax=Takifugu flavidus TaxID=433684 RepID=UPI0025442E91|nr:LOW QUALITY PROTEIN: centrosomal protein of 41 kDa [Takifugu flavidus]